MTERHARILVLMGGPDAEREVSLASGRAVAGALRAHQAATPFIDRVDDAVIDRPDETELRSLINENGRIGEIDGAATIPTVVFPVLHGPWGEGGPLQELLERIGVAFVGSGSVAARIAMDKVATKTLAQQMGVPTPSARVVADGDPCDVDPPVVVKPIDDGSSVDIRVCRTAGEIAAARTELHPRRGRLLVERYVQGREITVGMALGQLLPPIEIRPAEGLYDYEAKYVRDDTEYLVDCPLEPSIAAALRHHAGAILDRIGARDLARVDFLVDERGPWLLEVNTIPGFTGHSLVPKAAAHIGLPMPALCAALAERAFRRSASTAASPTRTGTGR